LTKDANQKNTKSSEGDNKFRLLLTLITLLKNARHKSKKTELEFLMVNQTFNLTPYSNCVYWEYKNNKVKIKNISGLIEIDSDGPYLQWLKSVVEYYIRQNKKDFFVHNEEKKEEAGFSKLLSITIEDCKESDSKDWNKWVSGNAFIMVMRDVHDDIIGGLWFDKEKDFAGLEKAILEDLGDGYAHALHKFYGKNSVYNKSSTVFGIKSFKTKLCALALLFIMMFPVNMSATAPAEIVAKKPDSISIPFEGVIDTIEVVPGQEVKKGDVLLRMDSTLLQNQVSMTSGALEAAEVSLRKTQRESMQDREKLAEIGILKAQLIQKRIELEFAQKMLERSDIIAERDGIVIFADANALEGRPVKTGEHIMQLADLHDRELVIRIPVNSMIRIDTDIPARFFSNVNPFDSEEIQYESIGYQASIDPGGLMTYKIRGQFIEQNDDIRIGWTGTGKVFGEKTILAVNLLRRPLTTLRRKLGI